VDKKLYEAPAVKKVRLVVSNAILAVCNTSSNFTPKDDPTPGAGCGMNPGCFNP
jgi:hypothetical protein